MKMLLTILSLSIFLLNHNTVFAQNLVMPGAEWNYNYGPDMGGVRGVVTLRYTGDEMLQSRMCKRLDARLTYGHVYSPSDTSSGPYASHFVYESGDTVFFFYQPDSSFYTLYNFDAQVGDFWQFPIRDCDSLMTVSVDSIGETVINGDTLRTMKLKIEHYWSPLSSGGYVIERLAIEKIGLIDDYFFIEHNIACVTDFSTPGALLCYKNDSFPTYQLNDTIPCYYRFVSVEPANELDFNIYPNPASNSIFIQSQKVVEIEIHSSLGVQVERSFTQTGTQKIDISQYSEGVYYYLISDKNHAVLKSGSFVKQ